MIYTVVVLIRKGPQKPLFGVQGGLWWYSDIIQSVRLGLLRQTEKIQIFWIETLVCLGPSIRYLFYDLLQRLHLIINNIYKSFI